MNNTNHVLQGPSESPLTKSKIPLDGGTTRGQSCPLAQFQILQSYQTEVLHGVGIDPWSGQSTGANQVWSITKVRSGQTGSQTGSGSQRCGLQGFIISSRGMLTEVGMPVPADWVTLLVGIVNSKVRSVLVKIHIRVQHLSQSSGSSRA